MDATAATPITPTPDPAPKPKPPAGALTVPEAARELGVTARTIMRLCLDGHLPIYTPPGVKIGDGRRGPKGARIFRADWDAYLASRRGVGVPGMNPEEEPRPDRVVRGRATGTDGISRIYRTKRNPTGRL